MELLFQLTDSDILKPLDAVCLRDNECYSTCCAAETCQDNKVCSSARYPLIIAVVALALIAIVGGLTYYIICMRKRRITRYDSRLNSIIERNDSSESK